MLRNSFIIILVAVFGIVMFSIFRNYEAPEKLNKTASYYNENEAAEVGAANVVTAVVVTYRGLDTLGEVTVLFLAAAVIGFMFRKRKGKKTKLPVKGSEILGTASRILFPGSIVLGVYVFVNGHLTPGGGFQGGAVIGSAILLTVLAHPDFLVSRKVLHALEGLSGFFYVAIGLLGIFLASGFLDNRILSLGELGSLISAGAIPIIYSLIGIKVGAELSGIITEINESESNIA